MKNFNLKGIIVGAGNAINKIDKVKALSIAGLLVGGVASLMSNEANKQMTDKLMEEKAEKAVQKLLKKNEGAQ